RFDPVEDLRPVVGVGGTDGTPMMAVGLGNCTSSVGGDGGSTRIVTNRSRISPAGNRVDRTVTRGTTLPTHFVGNVMDEITDILPDQRRIARQDTIHTDCTTREYHKCLSGAVIGIDSR